ncbi:histidine kinase [Streptomyces sp. AC495_CC817]|uniref:sensor histidine kinase n=1 Tax=Streptomyces sp. AC495_CC817 TaxID=2823900 RepID=UPI001C2516A3|nr:histidine kinase [Streptomyces sp. AC495_CC817]
MSSSRALHPATALRDVIAISVIVMFGVLPFPEDVFRAEGVVLVFALLPAALMPLRRRLPLSVLAACLACVVGAAVVGTLSPGALVAVALSSFAVAAGMTRSLGIPVVAATVVTVFLVNSVPLDGELFDSRALQFVLLIVVSGAIGDAVRSRRAFADAMRERAERAERGREDEARRRVAEERVRLARDLHDVVAHQISVISLQAGVATSAMDSRPEQAREALASVRAAARTALTDIGTLMSLLRDGEDEMRGARRPQAGLAMLDELIERFRGDGLEVELHREGALSSIGGAADVVAYLVVQEGLTNAHKHGDGGIASVSVGGTGGDVEIVARNTVAARSDSDAVPLSGHGLRGLRERVESLGGKIATTRVGDVFELRVLLPADQGALR